MGIGGGAARRQSRPAGPRPVQSSQGLGKPQSQPAGPPAQDTRCDIRTDAKVAMSAHRAVFLNRRAGWLSIVLTHQNLTDDDLAKILQTVEEDLEHLKAGKDAALTQWVICEDETAEGKRSA